jgi:hypothetical protein
MALSVGYLLLCILGAFALNMLASKVQFHMRYKLPNVVPGWPIIGNLLDVPYPAGMWGHSLTKKYGEM